jgi:GNAT superfamily N-acetyltransferase
MSAVRPLVRGDEAAWRRLWAGYLGFYRAEVSDEVTAGTFARLMDPASGMGGLVAEASEAEGGGIVGICNYVFHASTWSLAPTCYLQDLYVDPAARGTGAARALILECEAVARARGCFRLYWLTQEYNGPARSLYDTVAQRTSFIVYRKSL